MMVAIDRAGRIVIPKAVREQLELAAGTQLDLEVSGSVTRLERAGGPSRVLEWDGDRPVLRAVPGHVLTDADVQRLRDAGQR